MTIQFVTPPLALQKGGIENAVEGLREALIAAGTEVKQGPDIKRADAIHHFHGLWNPAHARLAASLRRAGRPYVVSPHGMLEPWALRNRRWKKVPYFKLIEQRLLIGSESLFVTSAMERDNLAKVFSHSSVEVLPLGCRDVRGPDYEKARRSLGWRDEERIMLFLSRVDPKKGLHLLFEAMSKSKDSSNLWRVVVVGDGPSDYRQELEKQLLRLGSSSPRVDWVGPLWGEMRWPYLQAADLFCLPTHSENFGIAVLEALHVGTPVLTTTGTPWFAQASMEGMFIAEPNTKSIQTTFEFASRRLENGWSSDERCCLSAWANQNFSWSNLAALYQQAYRRLKA
ncbi:glycosyltransferase [bacterium]|nr:glycosyltransferase [bacterium]